MKSNASRADVVQRSSWVSSKIEQEPNISVNGETKPREVKQAGLHSHILG